MQYADTELIYVNFSTREIDAGQWQIFVTSSKEHELFPDPHPQFPCITAQFAEQLNSDLAGKKLPNWPSYTAILRDVGMYHSPAISFMSKQEQLNIEMWISELGLETQRLAYLQHVPVVGGKMELCPYYGSYDTQLNVRGRNNGQILCMVKTVSVIYRQ